MPARPALIDIDRLRLTQIYLSQKKIDGVLGWFDPSMRNFQPVCARDFLGSGNLHITDGHTRAFVAWRHGIRQIPYTYDKNKIVTCKLGQIQYEEDIVWCERFGLRHIADLADRILPEDAYESLWRGRCGKMYDLKVALRKRKISPGELRLKQERLWRKGLFIYGISENLRILYIENGAGELFEAKYDAV